MKTCLVVFVLLTSCAFAGDPTKDIVGKAEDYIRTQVVTIKYDKEREKEAFDHFERLGFRWNNHYLDSGVVTCAPPKYLTQKTLNKLINHPAIKKVRPSMFLGGS